MKFPVPNSTAFFLCDVQEVFRTLIHEFPSVIATCNKLVHASKILSIPVIVTEHYPKKLGKTCNEINTEYLNVSEKTRVIYIEYYKKYERY